MSPFARKWDPWTSWAAAESVEGLRARQAALLHLLTVVLVEGATLEEIEGAYSSRMVGLVREGVGYPLQSLSGIRTRVSELVDRGVVVDSGLTRLTRSGRQARVLVAERYVDEVSGRLPGVG